MTPLPLVYVLSTGRSGSTLLDLLLGTHPQLRTVGEVQLLPFDRRDPAATCGCGTALRECPFWSPLLDAPAISRPPVPLEAVRDSRDAGRTLRPALLAHALAGVPTATAHRLVPAYGRAWRAVFDLIAEQDAGVTAVDSSKDPYRLQLLAESGAFDLRVVHLVRDPRAVVHSFAKGTALDTARARRLALRWTVQQRIFRALTATSIPPNHVHLVHYEDLARHPATTMRSIGVRLDLELDLDGAAFDVEDFRHHENHAIAGNPMRDRTDPIALDDAWRTEMDPRLAAVVWRVARRSARALGYGD